VKKEPERRKYRNSDLLPWLMINSIPILAGY
jgi:hypothetical protein